MNATQITEKVNKQIKPIFIIIVNYITFIDYFESEDNRSIY